MIITHVQRIGTSKNGNPRYRLFFLDGGTSETATDASIGYSISNSDLHNVPVNVTYNRAGRVINVEPMTTETATTRSGD